MDRFIGTAAYFNVASAIIFKIQYGQIYRLMKMCGYLLVFNLKSNMDRFIDATVCEMKEIKHI